MEDVKPTGMLGPASLKGCTISPVSRWKRLISPQGVRQLPKSAASLSEAADSDCSSCSPGALAIASSGDVPEPRPPPPTRLRTSSPQNTASDVGIDVTDQRKSHSRSRET